jgi:uncharacterized membrane protein
MTRAAVSRPRPRRTPGVVMGIGLGGFLDGILLHQLLHWHNMGSTVLPPVTMETMRQNMRWDGWFHLAMLAITCAGIFLLLREATHNRQLPVARGLVGQMLLGWGGFNVVEGAVNHRALGIHHVRDLPAYDPMYDWLFFAFSLALLVIGWLLSTRGDVAARLRLKSTDVLMRQATDP